VVVFSVAGVDAVEAVMAANDCDKERFRGLLQGA
jgi:hypothetical protein